MSLVDAVEARTLLGVEMRAQRLRPYAELVDQLLDKQQTREIVGATGVRYQLEVTAFWDDKPGDSIRVLGAIDDGGLSAIKPLTDDFILAPDGSFIGE